MLGETVHFNGSSVNNTNFLMPLVPHVALLLIVCYRLVYVCMRAWWWLAWVETWSL